MTFPSIQGKLHCSRKVVVVDSLLLPYYVNNSLCDYTMFCRKAVRSRNMSVVKGVAILLLLTVSLRSVMFLIKSINIGKTRRNIMVIAATQPQLTCAETYVIGFVRVYCIVIRMLADLFSS